MGKLSKEAFTLCGTIMYYFEQDVLWNTIYEEYRGQGRSKAMFVCYPFHRGSFTRAFIMTDRTNLWKTMNFKVLSSHCPGTIIEVVSTILIDGKVYIEMSMASST